MLLKVSHGLLGDERADSAVYDHVANTVDLLRATSHHNGRFSTTPHGCNSRVLSGSEMVELILAAAHYCIASFYALISFLSTCFATEL